MIQINDITKVNDKNKRHNHISIKQLELKIKQKLVWLRTVLKIKQKLVCL